jgi:anaerobic selenocysteine-containing dehydrogenase
MTRTARATCPLCEANCGILVEHARGRVVRVTGDAEDPFSRGYVCPKAAGLGDVQHDPDRLRWPLRREGERWVRIGMEEALEEASTRIADIQRRFGHDALGFYRGNPGSHDYATLLFSTLFYRALDTRNRFSSGSLDSWPRLLTSYLMYGAQTVLPIPDIERTDYLLMLGANPAVSNGSIMTAPGARKRLTAIRERGGRIVVIDPRRTETAELSSEHHFIRPGTDVYFLLALLHTLHEERLAAPEPRVASRARGLGDVPALVATFAPERVAAATGIEALTIRRIARELGSAKRAVCYGRLGTSTQEFGTLTTWLMDVVNITTGNFDREGGAMFTTPALDLGALAARLGRTGSFGRYRSRVSGYPEFEGELPTAALAEEMETEGPGRIRALVTYAGNPALSAPGSHRMQRALAGLDFMVSVDIYRNETTRHAHLIIPPTFGLEHDHYPAIFAALAVRNFAKYSPAVFPAEPGTLPDWRIQLELGQRLAAKRGGVAARARAAVLRRAVAAFGPKRALALALRRGNHPQVTLRHLEAHPEGVDLGPLVRRLPDILRTAGQVIEVVPRPMRDDLARAERRLAAPATDDLLLIGRRELRSNNSWMHNSQRLIKGPERCVLFVHPTDAHARGVKTGDLVTLASRQGAIEVAVRVTGDVMPGVVSLPHGWGHDDVGTALGVARTRPGVNVNVVTDAASVDELSGTTSFSGVRVQVRPVVATPGAAE